MPARSRSAAAGSASTMTASRCRRAPSPTSAPSVGVGMVFQQFNLFGHLTAKENIAGPLRWVHGMSRSRRRSPRRRVARSRRPQPSRRRAAAPSVRRPAAARGDRARACAQSERAAARRADLRARSRTRQRGAGGDPAARDRGRPDHDHLDPSDRASPTKSPTASVFLAGGSIVEEGPARRGADPAAKRRVTARFLSVMDRRGRRRTYDSSADAASGANSRSHAAGNDRRLA